MQVASLTGAIRQYNLSCAINDYLKIHPQAGIFNFIITCLDGQPVEANLICSISVNSCSLFLSKLCMIL